MWYKVELKTIVGIEFVSKTFAFKASPLTQINLRSNDKRSFHWVELPDSVHSGCDRPSISSFIVYKNLFLKRFFSSILLWVYSHRFPTFVYQIKLIGIFLSDFGAFYVWNEKKNTYKSWYLYLFRHCTIRKSFFINPRWPPSVLSAWFWTQ